MTRTRRFITFPLVTMFLALLSILAAPDTAANTAQAGTCSFNGRSTNPRIYNKGGVQGTLHIKRRDGSQISIGYGASAYVCPYKMWIDHRNVAVVRCSNGLPYVVESTWFNAFRYLTDDTKGKFWICSFLGGSGSARITTERE